MIGRFLAVLELMRHRLIRIEQEKTFGMIYVYPQTDMDAQQAVMNTISGAQIADDEAELLKEVGISAPEPEKLFADSISITEDLAGFSEDVEFESDEEMYEGDFFEEDGPPEPKADFAGNITEIEEINIDQIEDDIMNKKLAEFSQETQIDIDTEDETGAE